MGFPRQEYWRGALPKGVGPSQSPCTALAHAPLVMAWGIAHVGKPALEFPAPAGADGAFKKVKLPSTKGNIGPAFSPGCSLPLYAARRSPSAMCYGLAQADPWGAGRLHGPSVHSAGLDQHPPPQKDGGLGPEHPPDGPCNQKLVPWLWSQGGCRRCPQGPLYHRWQGWSPDHPQWFSCGVLSGWGSAAGPGLRVHRGAWRSLSRRLDARQSQSSPVWTTARESFSKHS